MKDAQSYISWHCVWKDAEGHYIYTMHTFLREKAEDDSKYDMHERNQWNKMLVKHEQDEKN